jgi:hypothetical protein
MELLTAEHRRRLLANDHWNAARAARDAEPEDFAVAAMFDAVLGCGRAGRTQPHPTTPFTRATAEG